MIEFESGREDRDDLFPKATKDINGNYTFGYDEISAVGTISPDEMIGVLGETKICNDFEKINKNNSEKDIIRNIPEQIYPKSAVDPLIDPQGLVGMSLDGVYPFGIYGGETIGKKINQGEISEIERNVPYPTEFIEYPQDFGDSDLDAPKRR